MTSASSDIPNAQVRNLATKLMALPAIGPAKVSAMTLTEAGDFLDQKNAQIPIEELTEARDMYCALIFLLEELNPSLLSRTLASLANEPTLPNEASESGTINIEGTEYSLNQSFSEFLKSDPLPGLPATTEPYDSIGVNENTVTGLPERELGSNLSSPNSTESSFQDSPEPVELGEEFQERFLALQKIFTLEIAMHKFFNSQMDHFFGNRLSATKLLQVAGSPILQLDSKVVSQIKSLETEYPQLITYGTIRPGQINACLNYLVNAATPQSFQPNLMEMGVLILLFGQSQVGEAPVKNLLKIKPSPRTAVSEIAFRLFRLQTLKNALVTPLHKLDQASIAHVESDARIVAEYLAFLVQEVEFSIDQVA